MLEQSDKFMIISQHCISFRFVKFCTVGASGVLVNLGILALLSDVLDMHMNLASALAIEVSINSNFLINELWTFRDRRQESVSAFSRIVRFHLVSFVGGIIQWCVFIAVNAIWVIVLDMHDACPDASENSVVARYFISPVLYPQDVGYLKYVSQLLGIGIATLWNYIANFHWTWAWPGNQK